MKSMERLQHWWQHIHYKSISFHFLFILYPKSPMTGILAIGPKILLHTIQHTSSTSWARLALSTPLHSHHAPPPHARPQPSAYVLAAHLAISTQLATDLYQVVQLVEQLLAGTVHLQPSPTTTISKSKTQYHTTTRPLQLIYGNRIMHITTITQPGESWHSKFPDTYNWRKRNIL